MDGDSGKLHNFFAFSYCMHSMYNEGRRLNATGVLKNGSYSQHRAHMVSLQIFPRSKAQHRWQPKQEQLAMPT
ncbi:hypothetical protein Y032_0091g2503 [Ancylostoma ceylanicum]|uniref:Uncharacterized protein n=1 Tax=Ancylostoma ceylanicum TaxID=53326 RepID=A0A016TN34_9BILA|nr:hypothetical protein Y032_0091g2503 [Ancylostoma ceylanicum]